MKLSFYGGYEWCVFFVAATLFQVMAQDSTATAMQLDSLQVDSTEKQVVHELDRMVVTATRTPKKQENVPATVTVIHPEDIEATPAQTVGDLLGALPGVEATEPEGVGMVTPQSLRIRGNGFPGHALILLDGQPINTPYTGYAYLTTVPVRAVRNIEVVRGAYSALYGSSAGGGIVNIRTKDGNDGNYIEPWGKIGDFGRHDFGCDLGLSLGNFSLGAFYDHKNTDNFYLYDDFGADTINYDYKHDRVHANLRYGFSENAAFNLSGGFTRGETGFGVGSKLKLDNHQDVMHPYINLRSSLSPTDHLDIYAQVDWIRSHHNYYGETLDQILRPQFGPPEFIYKASLNETRADRIRGLADATYSFRKDQVLTAGIEGLRNSAVKEIRDVNADTLLNVQGRPGESGKESDYIVSAFAQYDGMFFDRLELVTSGRLDYYGEWGAEFSPKAALRFRILEKPGICDIFDVKVSAGRGFRAPSLSELHSPPWSIAPYIVYQGNADLLPEELWAIEAALEAQLFKRRIFCRIAPYVTFAENLITSKRYHDSYNPGGQLMQPENLREVGIKGVDIELSSGIRLFDGVLNLRPFVSFNVNRTVDFEAVKFDNGNMKYLEFVFANREKTGANLEGYPLYAGTVGLSHGVSIGDLEIFGAWMTTYTGTFTSTSWGDPPETDTVGGFSLMAGRIGVTWHDFITISTDHNNIFNNRSLIGIDRYLPQLNYIWELSVKIPLDGKWPWKE